MTALMVRVQDRLAARRRVAELVAELGRHLGPAAQDPANLSERACPVCGDGAAPDPTPKVVGPVYAFHRCPGCTMLYAPRVLRHDVLRRLYGERPIYKRYWQEQLADAEALRGRTVYGELVERVARLAPRCGTVLDVGCGFGKLTQELGGRFEEAIGLELNRRTAEKGRTLFGVDLRASRLEKLDRADGTVDAVILNQVLEHLQDVKGVLAAAHRLLRPGGVVWIGVPHGGSLGLRLLRGTHPAVATHVHVNLFTAPALQRLARAAGFTVKTCGTTDGVDVSAADLVLERLPARPAGLLFAPAAALDKGIRRFLSATSLPSALGVGSHLDAVLVKA
jgi:SAM-dependent methyltransferase